ncbi:MAG: choice-of-anchor tandem repeat GloVer-containing protein [Rhizomicrobium sp.]|jgi:uncharacterized repeat protein (TIGR03803 family)
MAAKHARLVHSLNAKSGYNPIFEQLTFDAAGNLYGTARDGGANGAGTVFRIAADSTLKVLYSFPGGAGGLYAAGPVALDRDGNIYGTTATTVFKLSPDGSDGYTPSVVHVFTGTPDGASASSGVIIDKEGNLYGTTFSGGANDLGTVFKISNTGEETILHSFTGSDGAYPSAGVFRDKSGSLYGTTQRGGGVPNCDAGCGIVYKITSDGTFTGIHYFLGGNAGDGAWPIGGLIQDGKGILYGTTSFGGHPNGGTVFEIFPSGTEQVLYSFGMNFGDGFDPQSTLARDGHGDLYGTANVGGINNNGTVFRISKDGAAKTVYSFKGGTKDGSRPSGGVTIDSDGNLFGTTTLGGRNNSGAVFEIVK